MKHRWLLISMFLLLFFSSSSQAVTIRMTMYDDGRSCPANCDAHVVFDNALNGTQYAHRPDDGIHFSKCQNGASCEVCLTDGRQQCLTVPYRGAGPGKETFDFTPAFYVEYCARASIPALLRDRCTSLHNDAKRLEGRVNCIRDAGNVACGVVMTDAQRKSIEDEPLYRQCVQVGESRFNAIHAPGQQRSNDCAYERIPTGGPNSHGTKWRRLLPGACRPGTYVGRDGLDCCSGVTLADGPLGSECRAFYPAR